MVEHRIRNARVAGSNPAFGSTRQAMTPVSEKPRASRNRRQEGILGLVAKKLSGAAVVVIAIAVLFYMLIHRLERSPPVQPEYDVNRKSAEAQPEQPEGKMASSLVEPQEMVQGIPDIESKRPLIEVALRGFFEAKNVEDKLAWSRDPLRVRPLMQKYYRRHRLAAKKVIGVGSCVSVQEKGHRLGYVQALFGPDDSVGLIIEEGEDGQIQADWESLVRFNEMEWGDFLRQKPETPTLFRVLATKHENRADGSHEWLELICPGQELALKAFFDRKDPQFQPLLDQLQLGGWKRVPLTLRLCYSKHKSESDAACIAGSEGKGWLILTDRRS